MYSKVNLLAYPLELVNMLLLRGALRNFEAAVHRTMALQNDLLETLEGTDSVAVVLSALVDLELLVEEDDNDFLLDDREVNSLCDLVISR